MTISYLGHSSFLIVSDAGTRIVTDPYDGIGYAFPRVFADYVTVSHGHFDHAAAFAVQGKPTVADRAGSYRFGDVEAEAFSCYHDDVHGRKRGSDLAFLFRADGVTVCHLGDIGEPCSRVFVEKLGKIDVLMLPVGGVYTVDAKGAKEYADAIAPRIVIPMHYKTPDLNIGIEGLDRFLSLYPPEAAVRTHALAPKEHDLDGKIAVMERVRCSI